MLDQPNSATLKKPPLWGILGGMGPLASNEFLNNIYRLSLNQTEQNMPRVILISDPTVPDRTTAIKERDINAAQYRAVVNALTCKLDDLLKLGVDQIAIACITAHHFLGELEESLKSHVTSLLEIVFAELALSAKRYLLLRTIGTAETQIFERYPGWDKVSHRVEVLDADDQATLHWNCLYRIKERGANAEDLKLLRMLKDKYPVDGFIAGCTEVHLLTKRLQDADILVIDPLLILAQKIAQPAASLVSP
jgi:aspartate racemase